MPRQIVEPLYYLEQETEDYVPQEGQSGPFEYTWAAISTIPAALALRDI